MGAGEVGHGKPYGGVAQALLLPLRLAWQNGSWLPPSGLGELRLDEADLSPEGKHLLVREVAKGPAARRVDDLLLGAGLLHSYEVERTYSRKPV